MAQNYSAGDEPVSGSGYRLIEFLGRGGFGEVWKAAAPGGTEAALKIIRLGGAEGRKEFRALQLVKKVRHPNLVPINAFWLKSADGSVLDEAFTDLDELPVAETTAQPVRATMTAMPETRGSDPAELIIAMGLGDQSLFERLEQCRAAGLPGIPGDELLGYMDGSAEAVDFLNRPVHELGSGPAAIQHCDIKPHNIMIVGGATQVCDFGLARMIGAVRATTATAGTIAYAAPECLKEGKPSNSTDQYSLAVSYYELKTGRLPYDEETYAAVTTAVLAGNLDFSDVPMAEQTVLHRATAPDPAKRFASTREMVGALHDAVEHGIATAEPGGTGSLAALVKSVVVCAILAGIGFGGWKSWEQYGDRIVARFRQVDPPKPDPPEPDPLEVKVPGTNPPNGGKVEPNGGHNGGPGVHVPPDPDTPLDRAEALLAEKKFLTAQQHFEEVLRSSPSKEDRLRALLGRGLCHVHQDEYDAAIADFEEAGVEPRQEGQYRDFAAAYLARGTEAKDNDRFEEAVPDLLRAGQLDPANVSPFSRLGFVYFELGQFADAETQYSISIAISGDDPEAAFDYLGRGRARQNLGKSAEAVADYAEAIRLLPTIDDTEPELAEAYLFRGVSRMSLADTITPAEPLYRTAAGDFTLAARLDPIDLTAIYELRQNCYQLAHQTVAANYDERILALLGQIETSPAAAEPRSQLAFLMATCAHAEARNARTALRLATEACELTSWKSAESLDALAAAHAAGGDFTAAVEWGQKAVDLATGDSEKEQYRARLDLYRQDKPFIQAEPSIP